MFLKQLRAMTDSKGPPFQLQTSDTGPPGQDQRKGGSLLARELPVRRQKTRIVEKIKENRVTIILADTGSGRIHESAMFWFNGRFLFEISSLRPSQEMFDITVVRIWPSSFGRLAVFSVYFTPVE